MYIEQDSHDCAFFLKFSHSCLYNKAVVKSLYCCIKNVQFVTCIQPDLENVCINAVLEYLIHLHT